MNNISNEYEFAPFCIDKEDEAMQLDDANFHNQEVSRKHAEEQRAY